MKKIAAVVLAGIMAMTVFAGCGKKSENTSGQKEFILGLDDSFPPMGFRDDNNNIVGFDIDVATEVCKRQNWKLTLKPINWDTKEQELNTGSITCIWNGLSVSEKRQKEMQLSDSYMANNQVAVVLADSNLNSMDDLKGKKVAIQNGSTASDAIEAHPDFEKSLGEVVRVNNNVTAMMDLSTKSSDAVVMDEVVAKYYMQKDENKGKFKVLEGELSKEEYAIAFKKGNTETCDAVNATLKEMAKDGKLAEISKKWFGEDITTIGK